MADIEKLKSTPEEEEGRENSLLDDSSREKDESTEASGDGENTAGPEGPEARVKELEGKNKELEDKFLRLMAEFDNYRKRVTREMGQLSQLATENLIRKLLEVLDNFSRALDAGKNIRGSKSLLQGVELIYNQLYDLLKGEGLREIDTQSRKFDPRYHEAVQYIWSSIHEPDMIIEEIQKGYLLGDKVIRPSKVVVSRGKKPADDGSETDGDRKPREEDHN